MKRQRSVSIDWSGSIALPGLVAGLYQPLADGNAVARIARPCLSSAVVSEDKEKRTRGRLLFFGLCRERKFTL